MSEKRTWDETRSPQWRYLLSKDSKAKRDAERRREKAERELASRSGGASKHKTRRVQENRKLKSKSGREILYSASPGGENSSYRNTEFIKSRRVNENTKIFEIENEANSTTE